ncbi:SDR family oxidoreductase [Aquisalimonas asiatica]|uniref:Nucleoside-diphosphate-sugar epimerase n=1 Tax=Aquisalimonas asiatica TaxID=406100 RepID=A0A1H8R201_9GAMM|nr:SDR family oxidoreductase [Aquisalimonas asiatica]SEO60178.1 Nucleoside-diphosphate-sugar epimerase [Aquisalimonas asiatica]
MANVLIAGCGDLGGGVGERLAAEGHSVWGLRRRPELVPAAITPVAGDFSRPDGLPELPPDLDTVYFIATPGRFEDEAYRLAFVEGMRNLLAQLDAQAQSPRRIIMVTSTAVYGVTDGSWVDEDTPTEPDGFSGKRLLEAETLLRSSRHPAVILRFGGIYGPGRTRMLKKVRNGDPVVAEPPQYTNRIHRDDCVGALLHAFTLADPAPVYLGVDSTPCTQVELVDWLAERLGLPPCPRTEGSAGGVRSSNKRCRNQRLLDSGYRFLYPDYRSGYEAMLAAEAGDAP